MFCGDNAYSIIVQYKSNLGCLRILFQLFENIFRFFSKMLPKQPPVTVLLMKGQIKSPHKFIQEGGDTNGRLPSL
jgi:hypothetical protein